jgi:hypothetical protein
MPPFKHELMFIRQKVPVVGAFKILEMQMRHSLALIEQAFIKACKIGRSASCGDGRVKLLVGFRHDEVIAGFHRCLKFLQAAGDDLKVCVCPELRRQPRVYALGYIQCFDIFRKACDLYWRNLALLESWKGTCTAGRTAGRCQVRPAQVAATSFIIPTSWPLPLAPIQLPMSP